MRRLLLASVFCAASFTASAVPVTVSTAAGGLFGPSNLYEGMSLSLRQGNTTKTFNVNAGEFNINVTSIAVIVKAFCIDLFNTLSLSNTYDMANLPNSASALTQTKVDQITYLLKTNPVTTAASSAAKQLAIWEVVYEASGPYDVTNGNFKETSASASAISLANTMLAGLSNFTISNTDKAVALTPSPVTTASQQLVFYSATGGTPATVVPEPASLAVLGLGLFGLGMLRRRA